MTIIDVRERDEFEAEHIDGSIFVPLSDFARLAPGVLSNIKNTDVTIICRSGKRAQLAKEMIQILGYEDKIKASVYEGGILKWKADGKPTIVHRKYHLPIMRQVQLIVGLGILLTGSASYFIDTRFLFVTLFFGAGLTLAGSTGFCGMAILLSKMPWNKAVPKEELCAASPGSKECK